MNEKASPFAAALASWLPEAGTPAAVAVSGGPDSMALCHMLCHQTSVPVYAFTVDHGLRPEAADEAVQTGRWLAGWPHVTHEILKRTIAGNASSKIQEQAREDRYALLAEACARHGITRLFVAHHRHDQAETFLFRLAKGSGLDGLAAMASLYQYNDRLSIIRPLLDFSKDDILSYIAAYNIPYLEDPSNANAIFARVRLRQAHLILAEEGLTPKRLALTAKRLASAREALVFYAGLVFEHALIKQTTAHLSFNFGTLESHPFETRVRVLDKALRLVSDNEAAGYGPRLERLENLTRRLFEDPRFKKASLNRCLIGLDRKAGIITIDKETGPKKP